MSNPVSDHYLYLDRNIQPATPHYIEGYEGLVAFSLRNPRRRSDRNHVVVMRDPGILPSIDTNTESYPAGMWYDAHILAPDTSEADETLVADYQYYGLDQLQVLLNWRLDAAHEEDEKDVVRRTHTYDAVIQRITVGQPGFYDRKDIPGTIIPSQACFALLLPNGIRFDSFDCEELMHLNTDGSEYFTTRSWIESHWNKILPSNVPGCPEAVTYESGDTWIG